MNLKELKSQYAQLKTKYSLPEFSRLNEKFSIEKISEDETDYVLRSIRRAIMDKMANYLSFIETLMNPTNAPGFLLIYLSSASTEDKKTIQEVYKELNNINIETFEVELNYSEQSEANAIKSISEKWDKIKPEFRSIFAGVKKAWNTEATKKERNYFG